MSNVGNSILALSALALVGGAFLASASDAQARGGGSGFGSGNISQGAKGKGFGVGNVSGGGLNKNNFGPFIPNLPNAPGNGGYKPPQQNQYGGFHRHFHIAHIGGGGGVAIEDGCVFEKRLVRGVFRIVKVCPSSY